MADVIYTEHGQEKRFEGVGNRPIDAIQRGLEDTLGVEIRVLDYTDQRCVPVPELRQSSYIHLLDVKSGRTTYGVGITPILRELLSAVFSAR